MAKGTRNKKIEQIEATTILEAVKDLNLNTVITEVSKLQVDVQNTLAGLSAALTNKIQQIDQMDTAISLKESRLQELYAIENMAITLDEMKFQREEEVKQAILQKEAREKTWLEEETDRQKKFKRDCEDLEYSRNLQNKKFKDDFDNEVAANKQLKTTHSQTDQSV